MNLPAHSDRNRLDELLVDRATIGLEPAEQQELEQILEQLGLEDDFSLDLTAASIDLAVGNEESSLPDYLKMQAIEGARKTIQMEPKSVSPADTPQVDRVERSSKDGSESNWNIRTRDIIGAIVVVASVAFALFAFTNRDTGKLPGSTTPTLAEQYQQMMDSAPADLVQVNWKSTDENADPNLQTGKVVWSNQEQKGFMTFKSLGVNDPSVEQYQLWIFDKNRDEKYPVDGGVFDIEKSNGEILVKIDPKIEVSEATLFAITIEKPGGVVVSDRSRLPLIAAVGQ